MTTTIRNQIPGIIRSIKTGDILSEVILLTNVGPIASIITTSSLESLGLKPGDEVSAQIKATNISLGKCGGNGKCGCGCG